MKRIIQVILVVSALMLLAGCVSKKSKAYILKCIDESGNPVAGVSFQVCSDTTCMLFDTDENGEAILEGMEQAEYSVHVRSCPDGYSYDKDEEYITAATFETHTFTLKTE